MTGLAVLGSTGSIGLSTLDVVRRNADRFRIEVLTARTNHRLLLDQCLEFRPRLAVLADPDHLDEFEAALAAAGLPTRAVAGREALEQAVALEEVRYVMAAIVGAAGLRSTLAAARAGKRVLLANKEAAVMAGPLLLRAVRENGAELIPIDSEHNAVFQCLGGDGPGAGADVRRILLTASGGPFLERDPATLAQVTPDEACAHPNWEMGRKISVDSATMMNKGLEVIEACHLFEVPVDRVGVVIHPQSIVHSLVQFRDGSTLAQLGDPDMRTPISHALGWPERLDSGVGELDLVAAGRFDFRAPDTVRFPCLGLALEAARRGGAAPVILNAANEVAVDAFLAAEVPFTAISGIIDAVLSDFSTPDPADLEQILAVDASARRIAAETIEGFRF
ncbi:MAG: 1-deoxy-D-xylulose-5-phosphate reductoisomerase [Gammaproteobacteria bacterium]|jgi:1-deoxy-D-xylulose-5-phosphate reductoisomerase